MPCKLSGIGHMAIHVSNVKNSIEFYRSVVGLKLTGKWGPPDFSRPICFMRCDEYHHDLVLFELPEDVERIGLDKQDSEYKKQVGLHHLAFKVDNREDWLDALEHVKSCGVELVSGPYVHGNEGDDPNSFTGGSGSHAFYFLDPDGNRIEIYCWMMKITRKSVSAPNPDL